MNFLFCLGFCVLGSNVFARDFTLQPDPSNPRAFKNSQPYPQFFVGNAGDIPNPGPRLLGDGRFFFITIPGPDYSRQTQWLMFDMITHNVWNTNNSNKDSVMSHLVIATRGNYDGQSGLYVDRSWTFPPATAAVEWKGLFIAAKNWRYYDPGTPEDVHAFGQECNVAVRNKPHLYFEYAYFGTDPRKGFGSVSCADSRLNKYFEDDVKYTFYIRSTPDEIRYWIYDQKGDPWSSNYIADATFPPGRANIEFTTAKNDWAGAYLMRLQNYDTQVGIVPIDLNPNVHDWSIDIKNFNSGWFYF